VSPHSLPPLPADVLSALEAERLEPEVSSEMQGRAWTKLEARIALAGPPTGPSSISTPRPEQPISKAVPDAAAQGWADTAAKLLTKPVLVSFAIGLAAGAGIHATVRPARAPATQAPLPVQRSMPPPSEPQPTTSPVISATPAPIPVADGGPLRLQTDIRRPGSSTRTEPPQQPAGARLKQDARLAAERVLLERAQAALARRNATGAVEALNRHAAEFSDGELVEEREALFVRALVESERTEEARARADRFRQQFPRSVFLGTVETVLRMAPITKTQP
jgi:hypothetical protein